MLEQHSKDMEESQIISVEESKKDMKDYKNEPLLWDEESDRTFHRMMNSTKDTDGWNQLQILKNNLHSPTR